MSNGPADGARPPSAIPSTGDLLEPDQDFGDLPPGTAEDDLDHEEMDTDQVAVPPVESPS